MENPVPKGKWGTNGVRMMLFNASKNLENLVNRAFADSHGVLKNYYYVYQSTPYDWTGRKSEDDAEQ